MQIDKKLLERLETLSQIEIDEAKKSEVLRELNRFLEFVENLNELKLKDLDATFNTLKRGSPFRKDDPKLDENIGKIILQNAPKSFNNYFVVPKIIE